MAESQQASTMKVNEVFIRGRIDRARAVEIGGQNTQVTVVELPALDEYTTGGVVEIQSKNRLGQVGEVFQGICRVSGSRRSVETKNGRDTIVNLRLLHVA